MFMAHQVFLSHATEDRDTALQVCAALEPEGIRCWIAPRDVPAGTDYAAAILDGIRTSDLVLLIFSAHADASPYVLREIERAVAYKRPVLALRIDDAALSSSIEYYVTLWRKLDASAGIDTKQAEIVAAVQAALVAGAPASGSGPGAAKRSRLLGGWSRRKKAIALAAVATAVVAIGLGLGLGLGLAQNHGASGAGVTPAQVIWKNLHPKEPLPPARYLSGDGQ